MSLKLTPKLALVFVVFASVLSVGGGTLAYTSSQSAPKASTVTYIDTAMYAVKRQPVLICFHQNGGS